MAGTTDSRWMETVEKWVYAYQARLRAYLFSRTGDEAVTRDLTQEVFLVVLRQIDRFDFSREPWPWLISIAHNKLREYWRDLRKRGGADALDVFVADVQLNRDEADEEDRTGERIEALRHCVEALRPKARRLIEMIYTERLNCAQVAERLQQKAGAVRIAVHRIRKTLRLCVESGAEGDGT